MGRALCFSTILHIFAYIKVLAVTESMSVNTYVTKNGLYIGKHRNIFGDFSVLRAARLVIYLHPTEAIYRIRQITLCYNPTFSKISRNSRRLKGNALVSPKMIRVASGYGDSHNRGLKKIWCLQFLGGNN